MKKENEKAEEKEIVENEEENKNDNIESSKKKEENFKDIEQEAIEEKDKEENVKAEKEFEEKIKEDITNQEENKLQKKSKKTFVIITLIIILFLLLTFLSTIFAIVNMNNSKIIDGIFIEQVAINKMSQEEVNNLVNKKISNISEISVQYGEYNDIVKLEDLKVEINAKEAIQKAVNLGKTGNILIDNYQILKANLFKEHFDLTINIDEEKFEQIIKNIQAELPEALKEYSYEINADKLIITNGKAGNKVNKEQLKNKIIMNIKEQFSGTVNGIEIPVEFSQPQKIDIEKIYKEIYKEAKDAYIVEEPKFKLFKEEDGIDFAITIDEAKQIVLEEKESYTIPLKINKPKIKVKDLGDKLFKQTLSKYTTIYDAGDTNRGINIGLAAKAINGTILLPGEKFSYNGKVGDTTKEKGYKTGGAYVGGKVVQAYGGGICQLSSTLYNAVLYANLGIVERYNHSYAVGYVPAGRDATVSYGGKDFKFENTREYPIKIVASAKNGVVSVSIMGIKEEVEYQIELTSTVLSTKACQTVYENNSSLEEGKEKVIQKGYNGKTSIAYKIVKLNGKTISKTVLSKDTYKPMNKIVQVGTKKVIQTSIIPTTTIDSPTQTDTTITEDTTSQTTTTTNVVDTNNVEV